MIFLQTSNSRRILVLGIFQREPLQYNTYTNLSFIVPFEKTGCDLRKEYRVAGRHSHIKFSDNDILYPVGIRKLKLIFLNNVKLI